MIAQPSTSRVNSVRELYAAGCFVSLCPELPSFACACLSSSRRCSQLYMLSFYKKMQTFFFMRSCFDLVLFGQVKGSLGIFGQKWCLKRFDLKKYAQHENKCGCFCFFYFLCIIYWAGLWKFGQKSFASPKICLLLHLCSDLLAIFTCYFSGIFFCNLWFLLIVRVNVVFCRVTL